MENRNKIFGINRKIVLIFHRIMLIAMLHSTFIAPSQSLILAAYGPNRNRIFISNSNYYSNTVNKNNEEERKYINSKLPQKNNSEYLHSNTNSNNNLLSFKIDADINEGVIGVSNLNPLDDAKDNLFKFQINEIPNSETKAYLTYDLYGVQDFNAVSRSINDRPSTGGYLVKNQKGWTSQREEINSDWLRVGENKLMFSIPKNANYQYQIKNVKLEFDVNNSKSASLIINTPNLNYSKDNQLYIKGFLKNYNPDVKVIIENTSLLVNDGEYEGFLKITDEIRNRKFVMVKAYDNNGLLGQEIITLENLIEADKIYKLEDNFKPVFSSVKARTNSIIKTEGASLKINDSALISDKEISISKLRNIDIAPMSSGLVNVTQGGYGFRFLPDGTKFNNPVAIEISYDENLIPKGHNANEIKTFYFNTQTKAWTPIERDTINKIEKTITSSTNHFTDYINGIIQTPESPETAGFTPTIMSDIKAVDPSSEMTLISPPEVSQKGDANVSYPIKIPAGRKGMQPQIAVQYSSEGGNGWLGQGWNIAIPAITIDTKWGVPTFNSTEESEIYNLNGEQLMYPKLNGADWMPNRHYDVTNAAAGTYNTGAIARKPNLQFTPRKQGSFAKIERLGTATTNYYWKVTNTDGTINWYGGDKSGIKENSIIRTGGPATNIAHWGLYMTQDVFGNNVIYDYENAVISSQSGQNENLNGGKIFQIKNIYYTGFGQNQGAYKVEFNSSTTIRSNPSINARLGLKQVDAFLLNDIKIYNSNNIIRSYKVGFKTGLFNKTLLDFISENDKDDEEFYRHTFNYYNDLTHGKDEVLFDAPVDINLPSLSSPVPNFSLGLGLLGASRINANQTIEAGWEIRPAIGIEIRWKKPSQSPAKTLLFGLPFGASYPKSSGIITMADIDGNGIDDVVYRYDDGLRYIPTFFNPSTLQTTFGDSRTITGINRFSRSYGTTQNKFLESWDLKIGLPWGENNFHVGSRRFVSKSFTDIYFTDGNGDGLIDIVKDEKVLFNNGFSNGSTNFTTSSSTTPNMLITASTNTIPPVPIRDEITDESGYDVVRVWIAPKSGTIKITDQITIIPINTAVNSVYSIETSKSTINSGNPFRVFLKNVLSSAPSQAVSITNYNNSAPLGINNSSLLTVDKGQRFYFRISNNGGKKDCIVKSNPNITYLNEINPSYVLKDENGVNHLNSDYKTAFFLNDDQLYKITSSGTVKIEWSPITLNSISDNVKYEIIKVISKPDQADIEIPIYTKNASHNISNNIIKPSNNELGNDVSIAFHVDDCKSERGENKDDKIVDCSVSFKFEVTSDSNLKWKDIQWKPKLTFVADQTTDMVENFVKYPIANHSVYKSTFVKKMAPISGWVTPNTAQNYGLKLITNVNLGANSGGEFLMVVKKAGVLVGKRKITVNNGVITLDTNNPLLFNITPFNIYTVSNQFEYTVGFYTDNNEDSDIIDKYLLATNFKPALLGYNWVLPNNSTSYLPITVDNCYNKTVHFGTMYREWGQFFYNDYFDNSSIASDSYGKLLNKNHIDKNYIINTDLYSNYPECDQFKCEGCTDQYVECIANANINTIDTTGTVDDADDIPDAPDLNDPMYSQINNVFLLATTLRDYDSLNVETEKWKGAFDTQFSSDDRLKSGSFSGSSFDVVFPDDVSQNETIIQANLQTGMPAITKLVESVSVSKNIGWSNPNLNIANATLAKTKSRYSEEVTNFMDINGDRYPDIMSSNNIKLTTKTGSFKNYETHNYGVITSSKNEGIRLTADSKGYAIGRDMFGSNGKKTDSGNPSAFLNVGLDASLYSNNYEDMFWLDLNGDGLVDKVKEDNGALKFHLNVGKLEPLNLMSFSNLSSGKTKPVSLTPSLALDLNLNTLFPKLPVDVQISAGASFTGNSTKTTLQDINGDGLVDFLNVDVNQGTININSGNGFSGSSMPLNYVLNTPQILNTNIITLNEDNKATNLSITGSVGKFTAVKSWFPWPKWLKIFHAKVGASISGNANLSLSNAQKAFKDFNGDGYLDYIERDGNNLKVYYSRIKRTNLLQSVTNPLGGTFTIDYKVQPVDVNNPYAKWAMSEVTIEDRYNKVNDGNDVYKKQYVYENGKYDRREREFYGYKTVKSLDYTLNASGYSVLYRTSVANYHNQSYFLNGLLDDSYIIKGSDLTKKYSRTKNFYSIHKLNNVNDEILPTAQSVTYDVGGTEGRRSAAVLLTKTVNELYELNTSPQLTTEVNFEYDTKGRVTKYLDKGNIATTSDDYYSIIAYHNIPALNIISIPQTIKVSTSNGVIVRARKTDVNTANGTITNIYAENSGTWLKTSMKYDTYGNLNYIEYPQNSNAQAMNYKYSYDTVYNKYIVGIKDAFGYTSGAVYNSDFDKVIETTDLTGNKMKYEYDTFGRNISISSPKEINSYTISFDYYPYFSLLPQNSGVAENDFVPVAVTSHYDQQHTDNTIETYTFIDGMARPIQVKKDIWYNTSENPDRPEFVEALSVSGKTFYDNFGRATKQFHPWWETKTNTTKFLLNEYASEYVSLTEYDELDRPTKTIDPEGNESTVEYSIATDVNGVKAIKTRSDVDQDGNQHIVTETYKDVAGRVISTKNEGGNAGEIWTKFTYNQIGELMSYTDNDNLTTSYKYDMLGRKVSVNHPDNGITTFKYDNVNLISLQTANLATNGASIKYKYQFNRLSNIEYPANPNGSTNIANVEYRYGATGNQTGRLIWQKDATGIQEFEYGNMGELTKNVRTVVGPNIPTRVFATTFEYDSWNRLQKMTYPDGERITYDYDLGGNLNKMTGVNNGVPYSYIKRIDYDYYEQRTFLLYGNNTKTAYNYSPALRRLENLNVKTANGNDLFNNKYAYDKVGNVQSLVNTAGVTNNNMGGGYEHRFEYDNLNRLVAAKGTFEGSMSQIDSGNDANAFYNLEMTYSDTHGILNKNQKHIKNGNAYIQNTYNNEYKYIDNSHKVESISDAITGDQEYFKYDKNGNITYRAKNDSNRELLWDESNRLRVVSDERSMQHYIYDASGERVLKASSDMEAVYQNGSLLNNPGSVSINGYTSYPSAFLVITADGVYSKHYYAGTQRIVSRLGDTDASLFEVGCGTCKEQSTPKDLDAKKLQQDQKADLQLYADSLKKGTIAYKEYKPTPLAEQEKALLDEQTPPNEQRAVAPPSGVGGLMYYYHPDHLGTSTALTDYFGNAYQFFLNLPFGETMAQQLGSNYYNSPYKFNGKELDEETGFYYYGARYYDPRVSFWMSVDPLAEKMPRWSPYSFCFDNPMRYVDPDGQAPTDWYLNLFTGNISWKDGQGSRLGYKNLGHTWGSTDVNGNRFLMDGDSKQISYNGKVLQDFNNNKSAFDITNGFTIWGNDRSGDTSGHSGITTDSFESDDIPILSNGNGKASSIFSKVDNVLDQIIKFFEIADTAGDTMDRVQGVVTATQNAIEEKETVKYRQTTGTGSRYGNMILPDFKIKDTVVPADKASEVHNSLEKKYQNDWQKQVKKDN